MTFEPWQIVVAFLTGAYAGVALMCIVAIVRDGGKSKKQQPPASVISSARFQADMARTRIEPGDLFAIGAAAAAFAWGKGTPGPQVVRIVSRNIAGDYLAQPEDERLASIHFARELLLDAALCRRVQKGTDE